MIAATMEVALSDRMGNWEKLKPLFDGFMKDFGPHGGRIIDFIIDHLGGIRLTISEKISNKYRKSESMEILNEFYHCLCVRFGRESGEAIMRKMIMHLKGTRITFVSREDIFRIERDERIRREYREHRTSISILAERNGLDETRIWRILREE